MSNHYGGQNNARRGDATRDYRVRLSRFGSHRPGDFQPSPITVHVTATSSIQARTNAQVTHPDYTVTDVSET